MENRNILTVFISISALFAIVFGIGLMITWPKGTTNKKNDQLSSAASNETVNSWGRGMNPTATPMETAKTEEGISEANPEIEKERTIGNVSQGNTPLPGIEVKTTEADKSERTDRVDSDEIPYSVVERTTKPVATKRRAPVKTSAPKAVSIPKNYPKRVTEYWIQAGSFKSRASAENQNNKLAEKGFSGQIKTRVIDNNTYYRVRIGPYINKNEAGKFLAWIKEIPDLAESYISEIYVLR